MTVLQDKAGVLAITRVEAPESESAEASDD